MKYKLLEREDYAEWLGFHFYIDKCEDESGNIVYCLVARALRSKEETYLFENSEFITFTQANEEIKEFRLRKNELDGYMMYKKYNEKVSTYKLREGLIILPNTKDITIDDYMVELKNKIFTKVRKLSDEYQKFENNIIFVDVVSSDILRNKFDKNEMCRELNFFVSHIESDFARSNVKVVMKLGSEFIEYNLSRGDYNVF